MTTTTMDVSNIMSLLLKHARITESELSRKIKLPRATINRIVTGKTPDPRASTLNLIAQYFNVSVDQLLGLQPIIFNENSMVISNSQICIPVIEWQQAAKWETNLRLITNEKHHDWVMADSSIDDSKFGLRVRGEAMWPQFQENTILIINPKIEIKNRDFVIVYIKHLDEIVFRQLLIENNYRFLKAVNPIFPTIKLESEDIIIGIVKQVRKNY